MRARLEWLARGVAAGLFALLFLTFIVQVAARFLFDRPLAWSDELVVILYIAMVFWTAATLVKEREHVMFDLLYAALPPVGQRVLGLIGALLMLAAMGWLLPHAYDYVSFMHREPTAVLGWRFSWVYAPFVVFVLAVLVLYLRKLVGLLSRRWEQHL